MNRAAIAGIGFFAAAVGFLAATTWQAQISSAGKVPISSKISDPVGQAQIAKLATRVTGDSPKQQGTEDIRGPKRSQMQGRKQRGSASTDQGSQRYYRSNYRRSFADRPRPWRRYRDRNWRYDRTMRYGRRYDRVTRYDNSRYRYKRRRYRSRRQYYAPFDQRYDWRPARYRYDRARSYRSFRRYRRYYRARNSAYSGSLNEQAVLDGQHRRAGVAKTRNLPGCRQKEPKAGDARRLQPKEALSGTNHLEPNRLATDRGRLQATRPDAGVSNNVRRNPVEDDGQSRSI